MKNSMIIKILWVILIGILWEVIYRMGIFKEQLFPSILVICSALLDSIINGTMIQYVIYSLQIIFLGLLIGISLSLILSTLAVSSKIVESFIKTCAAIAHPLPGIALLPLIILWIGTGSEAIVFIIVHSVLWPLLLNTLAGFQSVPEIYQQIGKNIGLSRFQIMVHIYLPSSLPYFLTGLKIAWSRSWRALVSAEMIFGAAGGIGGIGWLIYKNRFFMDTAALYASILMIVIIGMLMEFLFSWVEKRTVKKWGMVQ